MSLTKWKIDPAHSELNFRVKHLMITNVNGSFKIFNGEAESDGNEFKADSIKFIVDATSIDTYQPDRDTHLKSADFFDVEKYKEIIFTGSSMKKIDDENYKLKGYLTIKDVKKEITLDIEFGGVNKDPWGNEKAGFSLSGKIDRKEYGLNWNAALESGGVLVGEEVKISGELQFVKQTSPVEA